MNYKIEGSPNSPVLIFSNSLGSDMSMWDQLVPHLLPFFRVLRYNTQGHGTPYEPYNEPLKIKDLAQNVIDILDHLQVKKAYFCGLSMGGLIGQYLGIHHADRFYKVVLSNTGAKIGDDNRWNGRIATISTIGMEAIVDDTLVRWFTEGFATQNSERVLQAKAMFLRSYVPGYSACCGAIRDADFRETLKDFGTEALVITGDEDPVTNVEQAEFLTQQIPKATLKILHARHLSATEIPVEYAQVIIDFLIDKNPEKEAVYNNGMHVRRTVLGSEHVDKANSNITEFNSDFQDFITKYAWGEVWTRPGLSKHQRSLITLSMLIALNRKDELKMHIKAAFNNGVTKDEIKEVFLHSALYCGLPAANEAIHAAEEVFRSLHLS